MDDMTKRACTGAGSGRCGMGDMTLGSLFDGNGKDRIMNSTGEIVVDNFAGGGGASTGIEMAIGRNFVRRRYKCNQRARK